MNGDAARLRMRVDAVDRQADDVVTVDLGSIDGSPLPGWEPGSHIEIELADGLVRHYSLCGRPEDDRMWRIAVLREQAGRGGSRFVHEQIRPGDVFSVSRPRNNFGVVPADRYLFIAGGIGITPILPMVRMVAARGQAWSLLYGGRTRASMAFVSEVTGIAGGEVRVVPQDTEGLLDLTDFLGSPSAGTAIYCCGPPPLLEAVEQQCLSWPPQTLHIERFVPRDRVQAPAAGSGSVPADGAFDVALARTGGSVHVPADRTLLEVLEDAGFEIDNSCRAGICGTCELRVTAGQPDHNDDVLSDAERDSNTVILPCVSRSRTPVLAVDL
ncbi:PDR/VanB family oxidoreductase [Mycobacterium sp. WMMD1722]|uniref:PDR/VanB family oxidoreductase n=1 Tax=Mycobacterium sp. WMMD1722 TaxID=3404117 RepID=UPI003BF5A94A